MGFMYENGQGVSSDRKTAIEWYRKAAKQGDELAIERLQQLRESD
jgi:TPR repeat protein